MASSARRVSAHRERMKAQGLRLVQLWLPDTSAPGFAEECRRQSLSLWGDPQEAEIQAHIDAVSDLEDWRWDAAT